MADPCDPNPPGFLLKVQQGSEVQRISLSAPSSCSPAQLYQDFNAKLTTATGFSLSTASSSSYSSGSQPMKLTWVDDEGDTITMRTQDDFHELIKFMMDTAQFTMKISLEVEKTNVPKLPCPGAAAQMGLGKGHKGGKAAAKAQSAQPITPANNVVTCANPLPSRGQLPRKLPATAATIPRNKEPPSPKTNRVAAAAASSGTTAIEAIGNAPKLEEEEEEEDLFEEEDDINEAHDQEELHFDFDQLESDLETLPSPSLIPTRIFRRLQKIDQKWGHKKERWERGVERIRSRPNFDEGLFQLRLKVLDDYKELAESPFIHLLIAKKVLRDSKRARGERANECRHLSNRLHQFSERTQELLKLFAQNGLPCGWVMAVYLEKQGAAAASLEGLGSTLGQKPNPEDPSTALSPPSYDDVLLQMQLEELSGMVNIPVGLKVKALKKLNLKREMR